jgi:polysaccharide transporter, PST family
MSTERTVAKNTAWLALQPLVMNVLSLAATRYIAERLGVTDFGRFNLGLAFVTMFAPLTHLGLRGLTVRHVPQNRDTAAEYLGRILVLRVLLALIVAALVIVAAPLSGGGGATRSVIAVSAVGLILTTIAGVFSDGFQAFERVGPVGMANLVGGILLTLASVLVIKLGGGIRDLAIAYVLGPLCSVVLLGIWSWRLPFRPRPSWSLVASMQLLRQAWPFLGLIIVDVVSMRMDVLVLVRVIGDAKLGYYMAAMSLVDRGMYLASGASDALLPAVAQLSAHTPLSALGLLRKSTLWLLVISLPLAVTTSVLAPLVIRFVFGSHYLAAAPILAIGIWRLPAMCLAILSGYSLLAVKRQDLELRTGAIGTLLSLTLLFPLVSRFGFLGGATALAIRPLFAFFLRLPRIIHHFPTLWPWSQLIRVAAAVALMAIPLLFVPPHGFSLTTVALILASIGIYIGALAAMRVVPILSILSQLLRRLGKPFAFSG